MTKIYKFISIILLFSCQSNTDYEEFIMSENFGQLFSYSNSEICFERGTFKEIIDSIHCNCIRNEYTGNYNILFELNTKKNTKRKVGIKGYVCPHSIKDIFYNPLNLYFFNDSLFIEGNLNSSNPIINSAEFGENIGISQLKLKELIYIEIDSLPKVLNNHISSAIENYTYPVLIQLINEENKEICSISFIINEIIKEYYSIYTNISQKKFNKSLYELNENENDSILKIIESLQIKCNIRLNTIQRLEHVYERPIEPY